MKLKLPSLYYVGEGAEGVEGIQNCLRRWLSELNGAFGIRDQKLNEKNKPLLLEQYQVAKLAERELWGSAQ